MHHSKVKLKDLKSFEACIEAEESIESDFKNYKCSITEWNSGSHCEMYKGASEKLKAVSDKGERLYKKWHTEQVKLGLLADN